MTCLWLIGGEDHEEDHDPKLRKVKAVNEEFRVPYNCLEDLETRSVSSEAIECPSQEYPKDSQVDYFWPMCCLTAAR